MHINVLLFAAPLPCFEFGVSERCEFLSVFLFGFSCALDSLKIVLSSLGSFLFGDVLVG